MTLGPGFDPYEVLGVGVDADAIVIQLAYKARIRETHPDIAGPAGLDQAKRLNVARDWLLDPNLRAQLLRPWDASSRPGARPARGRPPRWSATARRRPGEVTGDDSSGLDPFAFDFGPRTDELRAFFGAIRTLSRDERARVNYSLGEARPVLFEGYRGYLGWRLWARSRALRGAVSLLWQEGIDEEAPFVFPLGRIVPTGFLAANAYAQWILLGDFFTQELGDAVFRSEHVIDSFAVRCTGPWEASVRQARYGPYQPRVNAFFRTAAALSADSSERLARSWQRHLGRDGLGHPSEHIGPGVWLPAPPNVPEVLKVSGYLAAVDASRIEPPAGLDAQLHDAFRYGLRLTAHVLALGLVTASGPDYLLPWRDAVGPDRSLRGRRSWPG
ncbi:hypothetical protein BH24CHL9_BH24CHL9_05990 [soil metagenome]